MLDTAAASLRAGWSRRFTDHLTLLQEMSRLHRLHLISLRTDQSVSEALSLGLRPRRRGAGGIR